MSDANAQPVPEAAPAAPPADGAPPAAPAVDGQQQQQSPEAGQGDAANADGQGADKGNGTDGAASVEGDEPAAVEGEDAPGAPEQYAAFTVPEGIELAGEMLDGLTSIAKAHKMDQEGAQALVDLGVKQAQMIAERFTEQASTKPVPLNEHWALTWSKQTSEDPALGGDKIGPTMAMATRVFQTFATPELGKFFRETGLAHHPELIRFMTKVGAAVSEDTLVTPQGGRQHSEDRGRSTAKKLYPGMA